MNNNSNPGSWDYNRFLLKYVTATWQRLFNFEKVLKRRIFLKDFTPRTDDICVVTYMRSGTTLLQMTLYQMLTDGNMNFRHLVDVSPLIEEAMFTGQNVENLPRPRIFKTHGDYKYFPKKINARIIYVVRNGMDVASSMYHYYKDYNMPSLQWDRFLNNTFMRRISWFKHVAEWMENKNGYNVYYVKYEDLNHDLEGTARKLADFLDVKLTDEVMERIKERCSFSYMKQYESKFGRPQIGPNTTDTKFIRRGETNKGRLEFNEEQRKKFCELYNQHLGKFNLGYDFSAPAANLNGRPVEKQLV